ncbi:MAG: hypothetical protein C5S52_07660 [ANME-2 cluster archaeon]|nr:hypothetical protein [ANME-2 cluster archaeon]
MPPQHPISDKTNSCHYDKYLCLANAVVLSDSHMISETKISSGNSTIIPAEIRRSLGINPGDILSWTLDNHEIKVKPRKKMQFKDIVGLIEGGGDSVSAKKRIQRGE